ncbi:IPExxxVDY family protein [Marivirga harenae]|uniref:IPExxxVDY family protein n=1 Tax=Marivirga harenae TaxID=2010992 RepID=UPI0026E09952|nr:IPExxxVDY family protein [Marivirga harenae]WKV10843.1 IPExxxVDY family protein [Marivirga harenae]|tara:strand:- start:120426 stop:120851 length:426 start_codon:yes stop_codon:yes gene_type:complete
MNNKLLQDTFKVDFQLLAISSALTDFQMAWHINQHTHFTLKRTKDHFIELKKGLHLNTSCFRHQTENISIKLLKNKLNESEAQQAFLIPEMKNIDYFLIIQDDTEELEILNVKSTLSKIKNVILIQILDANRLKSVVNLMT